MKSAVKMKFLIKRVLFIQILQNTMIYVQCEYLHWMERVHNPAQFTTGAPTKINGTDMPDPLIAPDYRVEEPPFFTVRTGSYSSWEMSRPIRISPHYKQTSKWTRHPWYTVNIDYPDRLGCYCTTVYKRLTVLAGCALITSRHILTTATSTELVLRKLDGRTMHQRGKRLIDILGIWYDTSKNYYNSSIYTNPSRIHYHPKYVSAFDVNMTHPIPCIYDLSVWATTYTVRWSACICHRGGSHRFEYSASVPRFGEIMLIVGFQFVKAYKKRPMPWFKYVVRTTDLQNPCPKTEWGWFACMKGKWAKYGLDSGAALHRALHHKRWVYDGLIGMNSFSMRLRSDELIHYFTVINSHPVLDFLYDAYNGLLPYEYLDIEYSNTKWGAPVLKSWAAYLATFFRADPYGEELYKGYDIPNY